MTIHKGKVVSSNHGNDELYTTEETSMFLANFYKNKIQKYDTVLMPFNSKGSNLEKAFIKVHSNVISFDSDFFKQDFSEYHNALIFDNPPFSVFGKVLKHTNELGFDFYLFGSAMSMFHHLRKSYVNSYHYLGRLEFDNNKQKSIVIPVSLYSNIGYEVNAIYKKNKKQVKIDLVKGAIYSSGKIKTRVENGQIFDSRNFKNYTNKLFGGGMTYEP